MAQIEQLNLPFFSTKEPVRASTVNGNASQRTQSYQQNSQNADAKHLYQQSTQDAPNRGLSGQQAIVNFLLFLENFEEFSSIKVSNV